MATEAKSVILRDKDGGKQLLPETRAELVILNNGTSVEASLAGKQDALVSGENIKTVNNQSLLGSGNLTITGQPGEDGVGISSVVQTTESTVSGGINVITVTNTDGTTSTFNVRNGDAVGSATIAQTIGPATDATISQAAITGLLDDPYGIGDSYKFVRLEYGTIANDGTIDTAGYGSVSGFLPVAPGETIVLNNGQTPKVAYFDAAKTLLSIVSMGDGMAEYTVPATARFARFQYGGQIQTFDYSIRRKSPQNKSFSDLILSPLKTRPSIGFTGDSNTSGYGLVSGDESWANLIIDALTGISSMRYDMNSRWVESLGYKSYADHSNFIANSEMSIWTDATSVTLEYTNNYGSGWKWYVDGSESGTASSTTLSLDGESHKVTVKFTAGQLTFPRFIIPKAITGTNDGRVGVAIENMILNSGYDWIFIMIGTNHRSQYYVTNFKFGEYAGKGFYIVPFPNHKSHSSYLISQLEAYTFEMEMFKGLGYEIVNLADANGAAFLGDTYYQSDGIHFNASGHKVIANMVMGRLGLPLYLKA